MNALIISETSIRQDVDGRFCLNDLHRAAIANGVNGRTKEPGKFFSSPQTTDLIQEITDTQNLGIAPVNAIKGGPNQGTYVVKELVYAYAMFCSPAFHLKVIRAYDALTTARHDVEPHQIPQTLPEALRLAADLAEQKQVLEAQIEADRPKVEFAMAIRNLDGSCLVREFAKVIGTGEKRLYAWLRDKGYLMANNRPYQEYLDRGLFVVVEGRPFTDSQGKSHPSFTTRITGKGQVALEKKWRDQDRPALHLVTTHQQEART